MFELKIGDTGSQVTELQKSLNWWGISVQADGTFGEETKKAVLKFQATRTKSVTYANKPLVSSGAVDQDTWKELLKKSTIIMNNKINWSKYSDPISRFFHVVDVTQGDDRRIPTESGIIQNILVLANELDKVRDAWGYPIGVTSWYRPPEINRLVGGVSNSQHIFGSAADIYPIEGDEGGFESWLDKFWGDRALGYGQAANRGFTHVDLREGRIRWDY